MCTKSPIGSASNWVFCYNISMTPRRYFSDMMRSPNFRNETYSKSGGKVEVYLENFLLKTKYYFRKYYNRILNKK